MARKYYNRIKVYLWNNANDNKDGFINLPFSYYQCQIFHIQNIQNQK